MKTYKKPKSVKIEVNSEELLVGSPVVRTDELGWTDATLADPNAEILGKGTSGWDSWE